MSLRLVLAASAALAFAAPVLAQEAPVAPAAVPAPMTEAEIEARANAFEARMGEMISEMQAAGAAAAGDQAKLSADLDAIAARYQPEADAFAEELKGFIASQLASLPPEAQAQAAMAGPLIDAQVRGLPAQGKAEVLGAVAGAAAGASATE